MSFLKRTCNPRKKYKPLRYKFQFSFFSMQRYVVGTQKNRLNEHPNIGYNWWVMKNLDFRVKYFVYESQSVKTCLNVSCGAYLQ